MSEPTVDTGGAGDRRTDPDLEAGQVVGEYRIEGKLGAGRVRRRSTAPSTR